MKFYLNMSRVWDKADSVFNYAGNRTGSRVHEFDGTNEELDKVLTDNGWERSGGYSVRKGDAAWEGEDWDFVSVRPIEQHQCQVCQTQDDDLIHLSLYVSGSEGIEVCLDCRRVLTEVLRGMMRTNVTGKKTGYLMAKAGAT